MFSSRRHHMTVAESRAGSTSAKTPDSAAGAGPGVEVLLAYTG